MRALLLLLALAACGADGAPTRPGAAEPPDEFPLSLEVSVSPLRIAYLGLALWGAVHPMAWFVVHMRETGTGIAGLIEAWGANASTRGLTWDLTIAATAFVVWVVAETRARRNWSALAVIPVTFAVGLGCALPLYLFLRTRPVT